MNPLGVHLTLKIGRSTPRFAPPELVEALESVQVTQTDQGPSGFQMTFQIGRSSAADVVDYRLLLGLQMQSGQLLKPFNRVVLIVEFSVRQQILMDGIITNLQMSPSEEPGQSRLVVTGEDISLLMDLEEKRTTHPNVSNTGRLVSELLRQYQGYFASEGSHHIEECTDEERHDVRQIGSDRTFINEMARQLGFVFYVTPGNAPSQNVAYFGPKRRDQESQPALSFNMGPHSNVNSISFTYDGDKAIKVCGKVLYERDGTIVEEDYDPVECHTLSPRMARQDSEYSDLAHRQQVQFYGYTVSRERGQELAQAVANRSAETVVTATGDLDGLRYGRLLEPNKKVGVRGVGRNFDGDYYVSSVTHSIQRGSYKQRFSLSREGVGALRPVVRP